MQLKAFLGLFYRWPYCFTSSPPVDAGKIQLKQSPLQQYHQEGTNISLLCSADSPPLAPFYWFLNGDLLPDTGPQLRLTDIQMNQRGNSSCQAFNNREMRNETSRPAVISALSLAKQSQNTWPTLYLHLKPTHPVSNATVTSNSIHLIEFSSSAGLSCSSSGSSLSFVWQNGLHQRVHLADGGSTLTIINVTRYDQGPFRCKVSNGVG